MPTAICETCLKTRYWRNTRGSSIAGQVCECGGKIVAAVFDEATQVWSPRGIQSKNTGRKFANCALCGKRRIEGRGGRKVVTDTDYPIRVWSDINRATYYKTTVPAGSIVCWHHTVGYPTDTDESTFPNKIEIDWNEWSKQHV